MSRTLVFEWHKRFKEGREEVEDDHRSGRPSTSRTADNTEQVKQLVRDDLRLTVRMITSDLSISKETVWRIITEDLGVRKICEKRWSLNCSQTTRKSEDVCKDIVECLETAPSHSRRWELDLWVWSRNKTTKPSIIKCRITKAQESEDVEVESEVNVHRIFWYQRHRAHGIFATRHNCKPTCVQGNFAKVDSLSADQKKRPVWKQRLAVSSRQRFVLRCHARPMFVNRTKRYNARPTFILTRPSLLRFFSISKTEKCH